MNTDARRYSLAKSRGAISEVYLRTSASICSWTYSLCLGVNSRPFRLSLLVRVYRWRPAARGTPA